MAKVILISGRQGSGKSTLAKGLKEALNVNHQCVLIKYADPLYLMHEALRPIAEKYGIPFDKKEGRLLQLLGTEWGRMVKGHDVWVNACKRAVELVDHQNANLKGENFVVIDDARFENEFDAFPDALTIRLKASIEKRMLRTESWRDDTNHPSETGLDGYDHTGKFQVYLRTDDHTKAETLFSALQGIKEKWGVEL